MSELPAANDNRVAYYAFDATPVDQGKLRLILAGVAPFALAALVPKPRAKSRKQAVRKIIGEIGHSPVTAPPSLLKL